MSKHEKILSEEDIEEILNLSEVQLAKSEIEKKSDHGSIYFSIPLTPAIRKSLEERFHLNLSHLDKLPMRWIKGDTAPHFDHGSADFRNTYLIYLTNSPGHLQIGEEKYPISCGHGYQFQEGISHQTVGTGLEPRLLLGPMSEEGMAVGLPPANIYIRQNGANQEYSYDQSNWSVITWPMTLSSDVSVDFTTDITITSSNSYFIAGGNNRIGSTSLKTDGSRPIITVDAVSNYPGLVQNGTDSIDGRYGINIFNLKINTINGSTLAIDGGWFCQNYFARNAQLCSIINCDSGDSPIAYRSGGIVGSNACFGDTLPTGDYGVGLAIAFCSTSASVPSDSGGIVGWRAGFNTNNINRVFIYGCWSTGPINGDGAGGIVASEAAGSKGKVDVVRCYSSGSIGGGGAGGIVGASSASSGGILNIQDCYTTGTIANGSCGGIVGSNCIGFVTITNCYTTGNVTFNSGGGIVGYTESGTITVSHCYASGTTNAAYGYIVSNLADVNNDPLLNPQRALTNNYSEAANSSSGWNTTNAKTVLTSIPTGGDVVGTVWVETVLNQPFELNIGYTPYTINIFDFMNIINSYAATVSAGGSTQPAIVSGRSYSILQKSGSDGGTITIDSNTGAISTTAATPGGVYTLYIRNTGSYYISSYILTVAAQEKTVVSTRVLHDNSNYVDYQITYYSDGSALIKTYRKNMRTGCYQYVGSLEVANCQPPA